MADHPMIERGKGRFFASILYNQRDVSPKNSVYKQGIRVLVITFMVSVCEHTVGTTIQVDERRLSLHYSKESTTAGSTIDQSSRA